MEGSRAPSPLGARQQGFGGPPCPRPSAQSGASPLSALSRRHRIAITARPPSPSTAGGRRPHRRYCLWLSCCYPHPHPTASSSARMCRAR